MIQVLCVVKLSNFVCSKIHAEPHDTLPIQYTLPQYLCVIKLSSFLCVVKLSSFCVLKVTLKHMTRCHCLFVLKNAPHFLATRYTLPIFLCGKMVPNFLCGKMVPIFLCGKMVKYTQTHCAVDYTQTHHTLAIRCSQGGACMAACIVQSCGGLYLVCIYGSFDILVDIYVGLFWHISRSLLTHK